MASPRPLLRAGLAASAACLALSAAALEFANADACVHGFYSETSLRWVTGRVKGLL